MRGPWALGLMSAGSGTLGGIVSYFPFHFSALQSSATHSSAVILVALHCSGMQSNAV